MIATIEEAEAADEAVYGETPTARKIRYSCPSQTKSIEGFEAATDALFRCVCPTPMWPCPGPDPPLLGGFLDSPAVARLTTLTAEAIASLQLWADHTAPKTAPEFRTSRAEMVPPGLYGLPELHRDAIAEAGRCSERDKAWTRNAWKPPPSPWISRGEPPERWAGVVDYALPATLTLTPTLTGVCSPSRWADA